MLRLVGTELRRGVVEIAPRTALLKAAGARRVMFLNHTGALGGGEIALLNTIEALDRDRYEPVVVLFAAGALAGKLTAAGVETHVLELDAGVGEARKETLGMGAVLHLGRLWKAAGYVRRLAKLIRRIGPEIVHTNSLKADVLGGLAAKRARVPCVWHVRDRIAPDYLPGAAVRMVRWLARWVPARIVANSEATLETLRLRRADTESGRARVVHDGVRKAQNDLHKTRGDFTGLRVGIVGRISPWKGQDVFLRAAAAVRERLPEARFAIIGAALFAEHAYEDKLHELVKELGLEGSVTFMGFREDVAELMGELDIVVHASTIGEPFGQVVAEGMAAGCAVVATRGGGVPEIVEDGVSGLLVPMRDAAAMAEAIVSLGEDAELRRRLGEAGQKRIAEHFTIEKTARALEACWEELCGARNGVPR